VRFVGGAGGVHRSKAVGLRAAMPFRRSCQWRSLGPLEGAGLSGLRIRNRI